MVKCICSFHVSSLEKFSSCPYLKWLEKVEEGLYGLLYAFLGRFFFGRGFPLAGDGFFLGRDLAGVLGDVVVEHGEQVAPFG